MAGDWLKCSFILWDRTQTRAIARSLSISPDDAVGKVLRAWKWAHTLTTTGRINGAVPDDLDAVIGCAGFSAAMVAAGWLVVGDGHITFPDFRKHNGKGAKMRAQTAIRVARTRAKSVTKAALQNRYSSAPTAEQSRAEQSRETAEAEKSREDIAASSNASAASEQSAGELCSMLLRCVIGGHRLFDPQAAAAVASHPRANRMRCQWAFERTEAKCRGGGVKNPAGYFRTLVETRDPPRGWVERYQRGQLARSGLRLAADG